MLSPQVPDFSVLRFTQHVSSKPFKVLYNLFDREDLINIITSQLSDTMLKEKTHDPGANPNLWAAVTEGCGRRCLKEKVLIKKLSVLILRNGKGLDFWLNDQFSSIEDSCLSRSTEIKCQEH